MPSVAHVEVEDTHKAAIDKKKKKRGKGSAEHSEVRHKEEIPSTTAVPECANAGGVKEECIQRLHSLAKSRFCMPVFALMFPTPAPVPVPTPAETGDASTSASAPAPAAATAPATATVPAVDSVPVSQPFLSDRISRITLLRRICQVRIIRHYTSELDINTIHQHYTSTRLTVTNSTAYHSVLFNALKYAIDFAWLSSRQPVFLTYICA